MILAGGFVLGEVLGLQNQVALEVTAAAVLTVIPAGLCAAACRRFAAVPKEHSSADRGKSLWLWLLPVFLCAGFLRAGQERALCERERELGLDGKHLSVEGTVSAWELWEDGGKVLVLKDCGLIRRIQIYLEEEDDPVRVGMRIRAEGMVQTPESARNPGEFDRQLYYRSRKLNYRMFADAYEEIRDARRGIQGLADAAAERLARLRVQIGKVLDEIADEREAGIYRAVLLGERAGMDPDIRNLYQKSGIAHLLAVSGLHLSLVSLAVYGTLRRCGTGYGAAGAAGAFVLAAYAVLTGAAPSVLRALLMACCGFAAAWLGRSADLMTSWSLALILILWDSPYLLLQSGTQLSFGALAGIGWLAPAFLPGEGENCKKAVQALLVSISMQLVTLPILLYHFFQYPTYGIWLNFLVVPLMGGVVASGAAGILLGTFRAAAGRFALGSGYLILRWFEFCCQIAGCLPGSLWTPGRPAAWQIGVYYGVLAAVVRQRSERRTAPAARMRRRAGTALAGKLLLPAAAVLLLIPRPVRGLTVTFLDVGQGDGICLQSEAAVVLVDGGSSDQKNLGSQRLVPFLKSQGITEIDLAVVTHADQDHISGLRYLLEEEIEICIKQLVLPACGRQDEAYEEMEQQIRMRGGQVIWMEQGQVLTAGDLQITCLYPGAVVDSEDRNDQSLVLRVDYQAFHMLLTGDMTAEGEQQLLGQLPPGALSDIQVLKVSHHGSAYSTSEVWVEAVSPVWSVVSYGEGNRYGHPSARVMCMLQERGRKVFETAADGAVTLTTDGRTVRWNQYLK